MKLDGYLSEYVLAEIFDLIFENNATGMLSVIPKSDLKSIQSDSYYLWFANGYLTAITTGLDGRGLLKKIEQQKFISIAQIGSIEMQLHQLPIPLGSYLRSNNMVSAEQLELLFKLQTIATTCKIFKLFDRQYLFEPNLLPINAELTGLSSPVQELAMLGLRCLKDWSRLSDKLPDPSYALHRWSTQQPKFTLDRPELQLWKIADGKTPLTTLATKMGLSIDIVREISYRLIIVKLVQAIPTNLDRSTDDLNLDPSIIVTKNQTLPIGSAFLTKLKMFLKKDVL